MATDGTLVRTGTGGTAGTVSLPAGFALYGKDLATFSLPATNVIFNSGYTTGLSKGVLLLQNSGIQPMEAVILSPSCYVSPQLQPR